MNRKYFDNLRENVQSLIDLIARKDFKQAEIQHRYTGDLLDEILDNTSADEDIIELSKFQVLLNQLQLRIIRSADYFMPSLN